MRLGQQQHYQDENRSTLAASECIRSDFVPSQPVARHAEIVIQYSIWIVYVMWAGNRPQILGRCWQTCTMVSGSAAGSPQHSARYVISDRIKRLVVAIVAIKSHRLWTPLLWGLGSFVGYTVCTFNQNLQWQQRHSRTQKTMSGKTQSDEMRFLGLAETTQQPSKKHLQFNLQSWRSIFNFHTDTDTESNS
jgi:hypothetical protein